MNNPPPRPALQRAPDAEVHPARPGLAQLRAIPARPDSMSARSGPRPGSTSDSLLVDAAARNDKAMKDAKASKGKRGKAKKQPVSAKAKVKLPADLLEPLAVKSAEAGYEPDEVVALLVRAWLET